MTRKEVKYSHLANQDRDSMSNGTEFELIKTRKTFNRICFRECVITVILILIYFAPSIGLTFYQRWLLKGFHYPLTVVLCHLVVKFTLALAVREIWGCCQKKKTVLNYKSYVRGVIPTGITSGLDVGCSNWGLERVTVSLYTMTKSTTIIFILGCAILFKLEKKSWSLVLIVVMISGGLLMFTYKSTQFDISGFMLLLFASFMSGLRWTFAQLLMQKETNGLKNPIDMIYHVQPCMIISVLPFAFFFEGYHLYINYQTFQSSDSNELMYILLKILFGAFIAFGMEFSEFLVVSRTSSLTLSIAGIFKEMFILILAVEWNGDVISTINTIGLFFCLGGIICHILYKIRSTAIKSLEGDIDIADSLNGSEIKKPLIDELNEENILSESEESDSQVLFTVLNSRDR